MYIYICIYVDKNVASPTILLFLLLLFFIMLFIRVNIILLNAVASTKPTNQTIRNKNVHFWSIHVVRSHISTYPHTYIRNADIVNELLYKLAYTTHTHKYEQKSIKTTNNKNIDRWR